MNQDAELKLQAYLDGELSPEDSRRIADQLAQDRELRALHEELRITRTALRGNELDRAVPESREFYWSKIERGIRAGEPSDETAPVVANWWLRLVVPLAGASLLVAVLLLALKSGNLSSATAYFHEVETPVEESAGITFHSETAHMTVVWIPSQEK